MIRINDSKSMTTLKAAVLATAFLLFAAVTGFGQQVVNLTAGPDTTTLPDGTTLPMWGYTCGTAVTTATATCAPLSGSSSLAATGSLGGIYVVNGGSGYTSAPTVTITPATGNTPTTAAAATAIVNGKQVVGFNITNHGAGYTAGVTVSLSGGGGTGAVAATGLAWSPVVITVPWVTGGASLTINLTNHLSFTPSTGGTPNNIPTSISIVGQVGGGSGSSHTTAPSPDHTDAQGCISWFIAGSNVPPGQPCTTSAPLTSPPAQGPRVQSMSTEVAAVAPSATSTPTSLTWASLKPGTYLIESGTHPSIQVPMGLIGVLVVTTAPAGTTAGQAYPAVAATTKTPLLPAVQYNAEVPLEFSEIDPVQNKEVDQAVRTAGFSETAVWTRMNTGSITSLTLASGGTGYTAPLTVTMTGSGTSGGGAATATLGGFISGITLTAGGTGYTAPVVTISDSATGIGTGATATAAMVGGVITEIIITNPGSNYSAPTVTITDPSTTATGATATATTTGTPGVVYSVTLTGEGGAYTSAPTVTITGGSGTGATAIATFAMGGCGTVHTCYPPAVNYTPFYYLINGQAFDKTNPARSVFAATAGVSGTTPVTTGITGTVLVRLVNAGLRMHVPSIVGSLTKGFTGAGVLTTATNPVSGFTLIAEDGNPIPSIPGVNGTTAVPGAPRVQTDVFMAAGKTYDVMVNVPAAGATATPALPIYDRQLSLSGNSSLRDMGMLAYISVNNATPASALPIGAGTGIFGAAKANPDTYNLMVAGQPFSVSDPSKGVIANDINVYGVELLTPPASGSITCNAQPQNPVTGMCANGTFTYTPNAGSTATTDSFTYCANGGIIAGAAASTTCATALTATVTLGASALTGGHPTAINQAYTARTATFIKIPSPGLLVGNTDSNNLTLSVVSSSLTACAAPITAPCGSADPSGGFILALPTPTTPPTTNTVHTFTYTVQNSLGSQSTTSGTVTVTFPPPSNLQVKVLDAQLYNNCKGNTACIGGLTPLSDYRWIIEEDKTFWVDPNCTTNSSITTPGCPAIVGPSGQSTVPTFGVNFHTSNMDFVAQGCTGPMSCEGGQTMLDTRPPCTTPGVPAGCSATSGQHIFAICDLGNGACRPDPNQTTGSGSTVVLPSEVVLDPKRRYYISVLPGDAANPFPSNLSSPVCSTKGGNSTTAACGHTMSGAPIPPGCNILGGPSACTTSSAFAPVTVLTLPTPLPTGKLSVIVFEDDFPVNGEQDGGGGNGTVAPIEPGLGGFNLVLWDTYGGLGDVTGQDTYDDFNMPLSNSLAGTIDPSTGIDACPISATPLTMVPTPGGPTGGGAQVPGQPAPPPAGGMTGMIVTCPKYEADGTTLSPLAGQAIIDHLMPEKFSVQAYPGADRIARGEEWFQTNTLDGQHPHDSFIRVGEPSYFQEYGPAGYHVAIGFANPAIINARHDDVCAGAGTPGTVGACNNTIKGQVDVERISRTPDQRLYPSGSRASLAWTQCWVSLGDPDGEDFMFTKCDANGNFTFNKVPGGEWRLTIGDQWNDQIIDGLSTPVNVGTSGSGTVEQPCPGPGSSTTVCNLGNIGVQQWQSNLYTRVFIDDNKDGIWEPGEIGIPLIYTMIHYRDGHNSNSLTTDFNGIANFNETYPLFNWYVVEADSTRYKTTGIHTVYDAGGPADGSPSCATAVGGRPCGTSAAYTYLSNTSESVTLPSDLSVPGAVYCTTADCAGQAASFAAGTAVASSASASTGRIDPPWVWAEGWAGLTGLSNWIDFGKAPYASCPPACVTTTSGTTTRTTTWGENGGIHGFVAYAATRPFDSAEQMIQQPWEPNVPNVTVNLYQEGFAADGVTPTLTLVDTTVTSSWDNWAQGFYPNSTATPGTGQTSAQKPYMNCPGQGTGTNGAVNQDLFYFTLFDQPNFLDWYNSEHNGGTLHTLPYNAQYKCYDSMHIGNQIQPAPYDGRYFFPSSLGIDPTTGKLLAVKGSTNGIPSSMNGTNCTVCVPNPTFSTKANGLDAYDPYRSGTPMLPPGKYVVQVIMPPGYEVYKEEDKNLLIGDNYIAPVTQEFAGLGGDIFILPDQASVSTMYDPNANGYNPNDFQNETQNLDLQAGTLSGVPGFPGFQNQLWPCVGEMRVVPDYLSIFPQAKEVAPFAGATRPLCDRKEVTLTNQESVTNNFSLFTSTHIASKFTGGITDDFTSEFDPFSPQFGEKFSPPNMPISTKDYLGNEISRVYSDHWGGYDGLTFSSWEVNPPNITGYSPTMMVQCMNDPGPVPDTNPSSPTHGQMITDPLYNPAYSNFCYEDPYMPGLTTYLDTPVVPTQSFVGAAYNNADCSYPDATPAIKEVDGTGIGPWLQTAAGTLTITALGDVQVNNAAYSGPSASVAPFNLKTVGRHYGFGTQCTAPTATSTTCNTMSSVKIGGATATIGTWTNSLITVTLPAGSTGTGANQVQPCAVQQQKQYGGPGATGVTTAYCGQLVITAGNGKQSVDTVTVTIAGKAPTHVPASTSAGQPAASSSIQAAIDAATPGDLIIVDPACTTVATKASAACNAGALHAATQTAAPGAHNELVIMWKPVRLQGVGAVSSIVDASAFPGGKLLDPWRRHINCLFGLTLQGTPVTSTSTVVGTPGTYDPNQVYSCPDASVPGDSWAHFIGEPNNPQIDRLPLEAILGWDATQNGNLAEQLQEPSLMGAYEGAVITVLGKGVDFHGAIPWSDGTEGGAFPTGTTLLSGVGPNPTALAVGDAQILCTDGKNATGIPNGSNPFPSNFVCNPSSIDGLTLRNSSQGGGGIFAHGWAHHMQIANNRVYNNAGTLTGGIGVGQGEFPASYIQGSTTNSPPGSCSDGTGFVANQHLPYCLQLEVNVHNNYITNNSSLGDELFSGTLSGGGGATFCTGNDYYMFNYNWVCGNLSSAEGGGLVHLGEIQNGDIEHNSFILNQSTNPTIVSNGGGIQAMGTPDTDPVCGRLIDADCPPGLSDGTGHNLTINANLIQGNMAESGSGGGIRLQQVNGTEVSTFPSQPNLWNNVSITNNMIVNNVAGWDGAGISLQDALNVSIVNNTISSNDSLASSGVLTQSIGTPDASAPAGNCVQGGLTTSCPQSAGVTSTTNSSLLTTTFTGLTITCPFGEPNTGTGSCLGFSNPQLQNNLFWQNRSFYIGVGNLGQGTNNQQKLVSLFYGSRTAAPVQTTTGACGAASYWDIGVRGDTGPGNHGSGFTLNPTYSVLDDPGDYHGASNNTSANPAIVTQYCNGSRVPPECTTADGCAGPSGYGVPPGIVDSSSPNPVFSLTPAATVDEGNNWINVSWGPLSTSNDAVTGGANSNYGGGNPLGNYALNAGSPVIDFVPVAQNHPTTDFFGNPRPDAANPNKFDVGAVEYQHANGTTAVLVVTPSPAEFGNVVVGSTPPPTLTLALSNNGGGGATGIAIGALTPPFSLTTTCLATLASGASCTITVTYAPTATVTSTESLTITASVPVNGAPVTISGTGVPTIRTASVTPTTLAFGSWASGTSSNPMNVTVTNTGNIALAGGTFTVTGAQFTRVTTGAFPATAPSCGTSGAGTLAMGASCTIKVAFSAGTGAAANFTGSLAVAYTGATVTGSPVTLTGSRVTARAAVAATFAPNPWIVLPGALRSTATVTLTNRSTGATASSVAVMGVAVSGAGTTSTPPAAWVFTKGTDACTGVSLAPGQSCTVIVDLGRVGAAGVQNATVTFTDSAAGSPQFFMVPATME